MPAATNRREAFDPKKIARRIKALQAETIKALRAGEDSISQEVLDLLARLSADIKTEIKSIPADRFDSQNLKRLQSEIDILVKDFSARAQVVTSKYVRQAVGIGVEYGKKQSVLFVSGPQFHVLSDEILAVTSAMSTELIRGLSEDMAGQLKGALQRAVLGADTPFSVAKQVETIVGPRGDVGAGAAADRIVRTEVNRAYNAADEMVGQVVGERVPNLKKIWVTAQDGRVRPAHGAVHKQVRDNDEPFRVPIVTMKKGAPVKRGSEEMDYPTDPHASPGNTINCRCTVIRIPEEMLGEMLNSIPGQPEPI